MEDMAMLGESIGMGGSIEGTLSGEVETVAEIRLVSLSALLAAAGLLRFLIQFCSGWKCIVSVTTQDNAKVGAITTSY